VPGIVRFCHVRPPSTVRKIVPEAPLAQATRSLTALTPRSRAVTPLDWRVNCVPADSAAAWPEGGNSPTTTATMPPPAHHRMRRNRETELGVLRILEPRAYSAHRLTVMEL
jgi:hypothetical protein